MDSPSAGARSHRSRPTLSNPFVIEASLQSESSTQSRTSSRRFRSDQGPASAGISAASSPGIPASATGAGGTALSRSSPRHSSSSGVSCRSRYSTHSRPPVATTAAATRTGARPPSALVNSASNSLTPPSPINPRTTSSLSSASSNSPRSSSVLPKSSSPERPVKESRAEDPWRILPSADEASSSISCDMENRRPKPSASARRFSSSPSSSLLSARHR
ncbi:MAG: hypothetical protein BWY99_02314 [Synergistetes bacterium ADurb.BinA166]|nr:MAG: hypothetical protein BWY99_02314 [Synergistetes bacterium ADurb.BinA166]